MEQFVGMSKTGSIKEAAEGLKNPQFLMLFDSSKERFKEVAIGIDGYIVIIYRTG